jgi:hypothetical protein
MANVDLAKTDLLVIENVGNLVCPANYDLGEAHKVVVLSVTEGDDKPLKYPSMFRNASVLIVNKIDLLPYVSSDVETLKNNALSINPDLIVFELSCRMQAPVSMRGVEWLDRTKHTSRMRLWNCSFSRRSRSGYCMPWRRIIGCRSSCSGKPNNGPNGRPRRSFRWPASVMSGSSVIITVIGLMVGAALEHVNGWEEQRGNIASLLLIFFGAGYTVWGIKNYGKHTHEHLHRIMNILMERTKRRSFPIGRSLR